MDSRIQSPLALDLYLKGLLLAIGFKLLEKALKALHTTYWNKNVVLERHIYIYIYAHMPEQRGMQASKDAGTGCSDAGT